MTPLPATLAPAESLRSPTSIVLLLALLAASAAVHAPVLTSAFKADDFPNFYHAANLPPLDFLQSLHGGHLLMTRNAVFLAFYELFGLVPRPYFAAALATHLLNVALLFTVLARLAGKVLPAAAATALWAIAPIHQSTLGWFSVYGHVTAATFLLLVLADASRVFGRGRAPGPLSLAAWSLLLFAAATSFGVGLGVAVAFGPILWLLLRGVRAARRPAAWLGAAGLGLALLYFGATRGAAPPAAAPVLSRSEVVATAADLFVQLWVQGTASLVLGPLVTVGEDEVPVAGARALSRADAGVWGVVLLCHAGLAFAFARAAAGRRLQILGFLLWAAAAYGVIALGRASFLLQMGYGVSQMATRPRYHYAATLGLAACFGLAAAELSRRRPERREDRPEARASWLAPALLALGVGMASIPCAWATRRIDRTWNDVSRATLDTHLENLRYLVARSGAGPEAYVRNVPFRGLWMFEGVLAPEDFPGSAALFLITHRNLLLDGRRVRFIEEDSALLGKLRKTGGPIARLLVTPEEAARESADAR